MLSDTTAPDIEACRAVAADDDAYWNDLYDHEPHPEDD